jgi:hypothetical protein
VARYTHLALEAKAASIRRAGIKPTISGMERKGVYAMPVLPNFFVSHQWLRELRRFHAGPLVAVDFVIADEEPVLISHYNEVKRGMTASEAGGVILAADDPRGYEVFIPRKIQATEIARVRRVPQVVGWRYRPDAHGRPPCPCPVCLQPGEYGAARIRERFDD